MTISRAKPLSWGMGGSILRGGGAPIGGLRNGGSIEDAGEDREGRYRNHALKRRRGRCLPYPRQVHDADNGVRPRTVDFRHGLDVQLVYFRGLSETRASPWVGDPEALARLMSRVACEGGFTQMRKVLTHARRESKKAKVNAVVYVGDCIEEDIDELCGRAGELALLGVPMFLFQEGREPRAERAFKEIARLTRGAYCHFDAGSARQLRELLAAVAVFATGGRKALQDYGAATKSGAAVRLLEQLS
jgi:hypothetical protein